MGKKIEELIVPNSSFEIFKKNKGKIKLLLPSRIKGVLWLT